MPNYLKICDDCGRRYFSEVAAAQLAQHQKGCEPYQAALAEAAKAREEARPKPDEAPYEPPGEERRRKAAAARASAKPNP